MSDGSDKETVVEAIKAMKDGPRAMRMYMEMCAKCGTCASVCPVYYGKGEKRYNPAERTDIIRRIYRKYCTTSGRLFGKLAKGGKTRKKKKNSDRRILRHRKKGKHQR